MTAVDFSAAGRLVLRLYTIEIGAAAILFGLYKAPAIEPSALVTKFGAVVFFGLVICAMGAGPVARALANHRRALALALAVNVASVAIAFAMIEVVLRLSERRTADGTTIGSVSIRPTWPEVVEQVRALPPSDQTYFTYDAELGWTIGPDRRSADGRYFSSAEGIRSAGPGVRFADHASSQRIALIGDSNAFSLEVPFEESWGHYLGLLLGDDAQVLNFGVDGYGIDQVYLRYLRDVRPWRPRVVIIGFIQHDLMRSMAVYPFITFGWPGYLTKPRFDLIDGQLTVINRPLQSAQQIAAAASPHDLPFIDYDPGFVNQDWDWRFDGGPLLMRLLTSMSPRWPNGHAQGTADTETLNSRLLNELIASVNRDGAKAVLVYLPHWSGDNELAYSTLKRAGQPFLDMTECLLPVPPERRHVPSGAHYTGIGNEAIARCTAPVVACDLGAACE